MNDESDIHFGERVYRLRRRRRLSQTALGEEIGLSQASVSRLEKDPDPPDDSRLLAKLAQALEISMTEILEGIAAPPAFATSLEGEFYAFCQNPLCTRNRTERASDGGLRIMWKSGEFYPSDTFGEVNFCSRCGEELVKECPSCKRPLRAAGTQFCIACGTKVVSRPNGDDWKEIGRRHPKPSEEPDDDDLPF